MYERVMKYGPRLLFALSLPFFAVALAQIVIWLLQLGFEPGPDLLQRSARAIVGVSWLYTLSNGGFFLAAAVVVDRFDRWLAEGKRSP
jgi:hypothetical protein